MTDDLIRLRVTLEQMERLFEALDGMRELHLPDDAQMYAIVSEGPLDLLRRMRAEAAELAVNISSDHSALTETEANLDPAAR